MEIKPADCNMFCVVLLLLYVKYNEIEGASPFYIENRIKHIHV